MVWKENIFNQTKSSYSYLAEFSATWQQYMLDRVKIPRQVSKARFNLQHRQKWVSPASVKSKILFITPAKMRFPGQLESSPAFTARQCKFPRQVQQTGAVVWPLKLNSPASVIAREELYHRQDRRCSFKSVPRSVLSPGEENRPWPNALSFR